MNVNLIIKNKEEYSEYNYTDKFNEAFKAICKILKKPYKKLCINIEYVSEEEIKIINNETRQIDKVTDVLSFPYFDFKPNDKIKLKEYKNYFDKKTKTLLVGDVLICIPRAIAQSKEFGHSETREIVYLALHGMLHCFGFDHEDDELDNQNINNVKKENIASEENINYSASKKVMRAMEELVLTKLDIKREN